MKEIVNFSLGLALGVVLMQYFGRTTITTTKETSGQSKPPPAKDLKADGNHLKSNVDQPTREDIANDVGISAIEDFLADPEFKITKLTIDKVTEGVYFATGISFANIVILEGPEGLIIVDTMESTTAARLVLDKLRQEISTKPIKAVVLTHHHFDHLGGINVFIEDESNPPDIWSHHRLLDIIKSNTVLGPKVFRGAIHQFGFQLESASVWPPFPYGFKIETLPVPNKLVYDSNYNVQIAGLNITFVYVPGEADDEIVLWLPDKRVLVAADAIYKSFPNLSPVRGVASRDPLEWAQSVLVMRDLGAEFLVPLHGLVVTGSDKIHDLFTAYRSAMVYVHDQSIRLINEHRHPDEVGKLVRLPAELHNHPHLRQSYGAVEWTAKGVYQKYVGWFSGDPADLFPLTPSERSQAWVDLIGVDSMLEKAESALESGQTQWALELSSHVYRVFPDNLRAKWLRLQALRRRASEQVNLSARNYYMTAALDSYGFINWKSNILPHVEDVGFVLRLMKYRLKAELTGGVNETLILNFTDTGAVYRLKIVYSVLEVDVLSKTDALKLPAGLLKITTTEQLWIDILLGKAQAATAFTSGQITIDGSLMDARKFMSYF